MQATVTDFSKGSVTYSITDATQDELENKLNLFFTSEGYRLKDDKDGVKTYMIGKLVWRILLGAFHKYYKQTVTVTNNGASFTLTLQKASSGFSGGIIGMTKAKKEFSRLSDAFKVYFAN